MHTETAKKVANDIHEQPQNTMLSEYDFTTAIMFTTRYRIAYENVINSDGTISIKRVYSTVTN